MAGCSIIGEKTAFTTDSDSKWKHTHYGAGDRYHYSCSQLNISVREIVSRSEINSYGPIIPIIPSSKVIDSGISNLSIHVEVTGEIGTGDSLSPEYSIELLETGSDIVLLESNLSKITEKPYGAPGSLWVQYSLQYSYDIALSELDRLAVKFNFPIQGCEIPNILFTKRHLSDNEFIISPGP